LAGSDASARAGERGSDVTVNETVAITVNGSLPIKLLSSLF
jgi:hypothetical protein